MFLNSSDNKYVILYTMSDMYVVENVFCWKPNVNWKMIVFCYVKSELCCSFVGSFYKLMAEVWFNSNAGTASIIAINKCTKDDSSCWTHCCAVTFYSDIVGGLMVRILKSIQFWVIWKLILAEHVTCRDVALLTGRLKTVLTVRSLAIAQR